MADVADLGMFLGGLGVFFMGVSFLWWVSTQDKNGKK